MHSLQANDPSSFNQDEKRLLDEANQLAQKDTYDWCDDDWKRARAIVNDIFDRDDLFPAPDYEGDIWELPPVIEWILNVVDTDNLQLVAQNGEGAFKIKRTRVFRQEGQTLERYLNAQEWIDKTSELLLKYSDEPEAFRNPEPLEPIKLKNGVEICHHTEPGVAYLEGCERLMEFDFVDFKAESDKRKMVLSIFLAGALQRWIEPDEDSEKPWPKNEIVHLIKVWTEIEKPNICKSVQQRRNDDGTVEKNELPLSWVDVYEWNKAGCPNDYARKLAPPTREQIELAHERIRLLIQDGATDADVQAVVNKLEGFNQNGLSKYAQQYRAALERSRDVQDAVEDLLLRGQAPEIKLEDYFPANWIPGFHILRDGLKFSDEAIIMAIVGCVAGLLPPRSRVRASSISQVVLLWVFFIGTSGTAKSVLLTSLVNGPMGPVLDKVRELNYADAVRYSDELAEYHQAKRQYEKDKKKSGVPPTAPDKPKRKRNVIYTAPSSQGIRADLAIHGGDVPGILVRDELNGWLKEMANPIAGASDVEFWLSAYDGTYSNEVFADSSKSREVREGKLGVLGGIQPKVFLDQLESGNANGFNSRPLFVHLPRLRRELLDSTPESRQMGENLGELYLAAFKGPKDGLEFWLDDEAKKLFIEMFDKLEDLSMSAGSEEQEALWSKGPGQVLRAAAALQFIRFHTNQDSKPEDPMPPEGAVSASRLKTLELYGNDCCDISEQHDYALRHCPRISSQTLQLAANLVMAGKITGVQMHERSSNPMLARTDQVLEYARKRQGKSPAQGVNLAQIRKGAFRSANRPPLEELKQLATVLQSRGLVQLVDGGKAIRVIR